MYSDERTWRQMNLIWGVTPLLTKEEYSMEILLLHATEAAEEKVMSQKEISLFLQLVFLLDILATQICSKQPLLVSINLLIASELTIL